MQVPCPYILSRFLCVTLRHTSKFRSIWYDLIYKGTPPETDRVYHNVVHSLGNYSNSSTVGFEPQTYCMAVWQPNHYTRSPDLYVFYSSTFNIYKDISKILYATINRS